MAKNLDIVYTDADKFKRAEGILNVLNNLPATPHLKAAYSTETIQDIAEKMRVFLKEADLKSTDDEALQFVYEKLGGGVRTHAKEEAVKKRAAKVKSIIEKEEGKVEEDEDEDA